MRKRCIAIVFSVAMCWAATFVVLPPQTNQFRKPTPAQIQKAFPENTRDIFEHSDKFIILSLAGMESSLPDNFQLASLLPVSEHKLTRSMFQNYRILGQTEIRDKDIQERIRAIYDDGISDTHFSSACFSPKHGIRAIKNGQILDIVICFHCSQVRIYLNSSLMTACHFGSSRQRDFDAILTAAHVPLARKS